MYNIFLIVNGCATAQAVSHCGGLGLHPLQGMWDLWWIDWHWDRFLSKSFGFSLSASFCHFSIVTDCLGAGQWGSLVTQFHSHTHPIATIKRNYIQYSWDSVVWSSTRETLTHGLNRILSSVCKQSCLNITLTT
jgi:hypothetical protein